MDFNTFQKGDVVRLKSDPTETAFDMTVLQTREKPTEKGVYEAMCIWRDFNLHEFNKKFDYEVLTLVRRV